MSLRCLFGHKEGRGGGLWAFKCARCQQMVWRKDVDHGAVAKADAAIARGDFAEADRIRREVLGWRESEIQRRRSA